MGIYNEQKVFDQIINQLKCLNYIKLETTTRPKHTNSKDMR